jgi:acylphosphatase
MTGLQRLQATIHGRVQGVAFRHYAQLRARDLELTGYVRNRWDGTVEIVAEGPRDALDEFLLFLRVGPRAAVVTRADVEWREPSGQFSRFEVRF